MIWQWAWLGLWVGCFLVGAYTVSGWIADLMTGRRHKVRLVSLAEYQKIIARNAVEQAEVADVCVKALERAWEAMRSGDKKLAEREIEYVLEQIA